MNVLRMVLAISSVIFLLQCQAVENTGNRNPPEAEPGVAELSNYLSGLSAVSNQSDYKTLYSDTGYRRYSESLDSLWEKIKTRNIEPIKDWKARHFPEARTNVAFYPFSGADFINLYTFYPASTRYIMIALEPRGVIKKPDSISAIRRRSALQSMESLIEEISARNYFTRVRMRKTLHSQDINGTLPVLIVFLTRLGHSVLSYEHVKLNDSGKLVSDDDKKSTHKGQGVKIHFFDKSDQKQKELIYLDLYINPDSFDSKTPEGKFLLSQGKLSTFLKSAEYILHQSKYTSFNQSLVESSRMITQDDSGIPYRFLTETHEIKAYGKYTDRFYLKGTPGVSGQKDLKQLYQNPEGPLPFAFGYGILHGKSKSNLLVAVSNSVSE